MRPLTANLKLFYQCRRLAIWLPFLGMAILLAIVGTAERKPELGMFWFLPVLMAGFAAACVARDVMARPFSFGLPGHRAVVAKLLLRVGAVLVPAASLAFLLTAAVTRGVGVGDLFCGVTLAAAAYLAGVALVFGADWNAQAFYILVTPVYFVGTLPLPYRLAEAVLRAHPWEVSAVALVAGAVLVPWCLPERCARRACGRPWIGPSDTWNRARLARAGKERLARKLGAPSAVPSLLERVVLPRLARSGAATLARDVWGEAFAIGSRYRPANVLRTFVFALAMVALFGLWTGFLSPTASSPADSGHLSDFMRSFANFLILFAPMFLLQFPSPFFSTLLLASGRRERFRREIVTGGHLFVVVSGATVLVVLFCRWLFPVIPSFRVGTYTLALWPPDLWAVTVLLWSVPACLLVRLIVPRRTVAWPVLVGGLLMGSAFFWILLFASLPAASIVVIGLVFWALYVAVAWRTVAKKDLAA